MTEYIHLIGADDVRKAASSIQSAASDMMWAASSIEESLFRHRLFLEEWLGRLEQAFNLLNQKMK